MQATIYVTKEAFAVADRIKDLDYGERIDLQDEEPDLSTQEGYYLKNINYLRVAALPANANVALRLVPDDAELYRRYVSMPINMRGCVFEHAALEKGVAEILPYWSGPAIGASDGNTVHFQCPQNEYMVSLVPSADDADVLVPADKLLSEGIVVAISEVAQLTAQLSLHDFIELQVPVVPEMVGIEGDDFRSAKAYATGPTPQCERVFLQMADILRSPDPNRIYIDLIHPLMISYGYFY